MPRLFIALPIPASVRQELAQLPMDPLPPWRWVNPDLYHITLAFIGEVSETRVAAINAVVTQTATEMKTSSFQLSAHGLGAFPNMQRPRVAWAGITGDTTELIHWQTRLTANLIQAGFTMERRPFTPHITLGRARQSASFPTSWQPFVDTLFGSWTAENIHIVESQLSPGGPRYTVRHSIALLPGRV